METYWDAFLREVYLGDKGIAKVLEMFYDYLNKKGVIKASPSQKIEPSAWQLTDLRRLWEKQCEIIAHINKVL